MERMRFMVSTIMIGVKLTTMPEKREIMTLTLLGNLPMMGNLTMLRNLTMLGAFSMLGTLPVMLVNFTLLETLTLLKTLTMLVTLILLGKIKLTCGKKTQRAGDSRMAGYKYFLTR